MTLNVNLKLWKRIHVRAQRISIQISAKSARLHTLLLDVQIFCNRLILRVPCSQALPGNCIEEGLRLHLVAEPETLRYEAEPRNERTICYPRLSRV